MVWCGRRGRVVEKIRRRQFKALCTPDRRGIRLTRPFSEARRAGCATTRLDSQPPRLLATATAISFKAGSQHGLSRHVRHVVSLRRRSCLPFPGCLYQDVDGAVDRASPSPARSARGVPRSTARFVPQPPFSLYHLGSDRDARPSLLYTSPASDTGDTGSSTFYEFHAFHGPRLTSSTPSDSSSTLPDRGTESGWPSSDPAYPCQSLRRKPS